jgi:hypothetical protein
LVTQHGVVQSTIQMTDVNDSNIDLIIKKTTLKVENIRGILTNINKKLTNLKDAVNDIR